MLNPTLQNNHYLAFITLYTADSLVSSKKCAKFAGRKRNNNNTMLIERKRYLDKLIAAQGDGMVKVVTGGRRCGKSFLLLNIFHNYLLEQGIQPEQIVELALDNRKNRKYLDPDALIAYIDSKTEGDYARYYIILDEVQMVREFVSVLLTLMHDSRFDIYVSGSNSRFLSKDIVTEFRGRSSEIRVWPLSFAEYYAAVGGERRLAWEDYYTYGGLPQILTRDGYEAKVGLLEDIYQATYLKDVIERNHLRNVEGMHQVAQIMASCIGSPVNPKRISNTFASVEGVSINHETVKHYITHLCDAFLMEEAQRYDVKGRKYIGSESKYYFVDLGLRAAAINFRQQEESHIMENVIYNELRMRGYRVDVGMVEMWKRNEDESRQRLKLEIDFVVNLGAERIYIQSAYQMPNEEKRAQEERPLLQAKDNFKKIIIVWEDIHTKINEDGVITMSLLNFLLDKDSLLKVLK